MTKEVHFVNLFEILKHFFQLPASGHAIWPPAQFSSTAAWRIFFSSSLASFLAPSHPWTPDRFLNRSSLSVTALEMAIRSLTAFLMVVG